MTDNELKEQQEQKIQQLMLDSCAELTAQILNEMNRIGAMTDIPQPMRFSIVFTSLAQALTALIQGHHPDNWRVMLEKFTAEVGFMVATDNNARNKKNEEV